ncbi:hypothetical protein swp_3695 [Shewanella piezotolerans WP3]|uniref:Lipoprotein n=1 Tax=Shewanella piezotolerans (strain WP3 / JCM 13877) TaxID=225849 RepID=B8CS91_SHEPW|nr:hypothetical protein [Shewanella piezotolerans]ACJ30381.1 hypothetical protein swp_3695 [Shewanella piezotolerans WP3]
MKNIFAISIAVFLSGCVSVNTVEQLKISGKKSEEYCSAISPEKLEQSYSNYLGQCFKTSSVDMGSATVGEIMTVSRLSTNNGVDLRVVKTIVKGNSYQLVVSIDEGNEQCRSVVRAYAYNWTQANHFENIKVISDNGTADKCANDLF